MRFSDSIGRGAELFADDVAVDDGGARRTFAELGARVAALARGLLALGVKRQNRVAVVSTNRCEYVELYLALARIDAVIAPVNWRLHEREFEHVIADSEAVAVIAESRFVDALGSCRAKCAGVAHWISIGDERPNWRPYESCFGGSEAPPDRATLDPESIAIQMYTSGTTGLPKGALLSHRNVCSMTVAWLREIDLGRAPDRFVLGTPLFHVGGMLQMSSTLASGAALRLFPEFLPGLAVDALEREHATHGGFVPAMLQWILNEKGLAERRFPTLRLIIYGAAPMPAPTLSRAVAVFGCGFLQGYGLTETSGVITVLGPNDHRYDPSGPPPARLSSAGRPVQGCEVRVVDEHGSDVALDVVGEVVARGDQVGPGYWKRPDDTRESWRDGWFHTGDLATRDAQGYITIVDRSKDMILVAGENVYPSQVENALREHPAIADVAVIGIPHETWGEEVLGLVVIRAEVAASDAELIQHCRGRLARFKCPTRIERRDAIPRNAAGKVLKRELRAPYWEGRARRV
jgi:long-chain acyl-CoA synthetase